MLSDEDVRVMLREKAGWKGAATLAAHLGISRSYLSEVMNGRKGANDLILSRLGLRRTIVRIPRKERLQSMSEDA